MRRDYLMIAALGTLILAVAIGGVAALLAPPSPRLLLPAGATLLRVERQGLGRVVVVAHLQPRQNRYTVYQHLVSNGWRLRRVNVLPDDTAQNLFRRSLDGHVLEMVMLSRDQRDHATVTLVYYRCLLQVTCTWR